MDQVIRNSLGERIDYTFTAGADGNRRAGVIVLLGHGVTGNKERPIVVDTARALEEAGWDTLRFSFAGNGDSEGDFREATITKESRDLKAVLDAVSPLCPRVIYIGHSMGAAVGVRVAAVDARITALVSLAGMVRTKTFAETEFGDVIPDKGVMWEEEACPLSSAFMDDLCRQVVSVEAEARRVAVPWLLIHGTADDVVLPADTARIAELRGSEVEVLEIKAADHSFADPPAKAQLCRKVVEWLDRLAGSRDPAWRDHDG